ncbi:MAG: GH3 auxin-responsive promoter family protein [Muribaculaceae bacterium]|nr:GH3 auxin-responsive promoter family protein [Muribaculaceae bacterium]
MNFTPIARLIMKRRGLRPEGWHGHTADVQLSQLRWLLFRGASTEYGCRYGFEEILKESDIAEAFAERVPMVGYEDIRRLVMRMTDGEPDILWPGRCLRFAQSSGTSGGRSKFIPVTKDSLKVNHFAGSADTVAQYLRHYPESRLFAGKGMILGGSFESALRPKGKDVRVGDLSATLIDSIPEVGNLFRVPDKETALLSDWNVKLDRMARKAIGEHITNISGVPSWFLRVIRRALEISGRAHGHELWPDMEVFFHGGIAFGPYREEYDALFDPARMHYFETYNASEGFFATQAARDNDGLMLLIDNGVYFEFLPQGSGDNARPLRADQLEEGVVYEMVITSCNGLWRYRIGDTVEVISTDPLKIRVAGRTHSYINAFGEELMESNAEDAIAAASQQTGAKVRNYTAGPVYTHGDRKGRHQWLIEWEEPPADSEAFCRILDEELKRVNSDYAAKRSDDIFLDHPEITSLPDGSFDHWLATQGSGKLGGQRKIPRLHNARSIIDDLLRNINVNKTI